MLERYTERARRVLFFARYEASQFGSLEIETEQLLLGVLREDKALANRFLGSSANCESIRQQITQHTPARGKVSTSVDLPLSHESKRVLGYAAEESERMGQKHLDTPHLLLGLLREERCFAAGLLQERGLRLAQAREAVARWNPDSMEPRPSKREPAQALVRLLLAWKELGGLTVAATPTVGHHTPDFAIYAGDAAEPGGEREGPTPFLCIEIVRDESFSALQRRFDDYLSAGVGLVWVLNFPAKRAYTVTAAEGLREFKGERLQIADRGLELELKTLFA